MPLIIEYFNDGRRVVRVRKDWHPGRISRAYTPPMRNHVQSADAHRLQTLLLKMRGTK